MTVPIALVILHSITIYVFALHISESINSRKWHINKMARNPTTNWRSHTSLLAYRVKNTVSFSFPPLFKFMFLYFIRWRIYFTYSNPRSEQKKKKKKSVPVVERDRSDCMWIHKSCLDGSLLCKVRNIIQKGERATRKIHDLLEMVAYKSLSCPWWG